MRIHDEFQYAAPPEKVAEMLADPTFYEQVSERMGAVSATVEVSGDPSGPFTVTTERKMPTDGFPDFARKFVGDTVSVRQVDEWHAEEEGGVRRGTLLVEVHGAPLRMHGSLLLAPTDTGTTETVDGELKAAVPLIGGKLEEAARPAIEGAIRQQQKVGAAWFAG
ncbi:MAG TPA: DUF2505 domain-containing protein [Actinomycetales bacterium]|nr:DUF2505 domain-containing protein [Actinomycetales bacterium]